MERIIIKFTKTKEAKFISHLDLMRTINRALKRAGLSVAYSKGYNPHPNISFAAPLSLGIGSEAEYCDIELESAEEENKIIDGLNSVLPAGIRVISSISVKTKLPPTMALVEGALYSIALGDCVEETEAINIVNGILGMGEINRLKKTKTGEKMVNIRPMIHDLRISASDNDQVVFECLISTGSRANLNPDILSEIIKEQSYGKLKGYAEIIRRELFTQSDGKWVSLAEYIQEK